MTDKPEEKLLPCPFCGNQPKLNLRDGGVYCPACGVSAVTVEVWNRRTDAQHEGEILQELSGCLLDIRCLCPETDACERPCDKCRASKLVEKLKAKSAATPQPEGKKLNLKLKSTEQHKKMIQDMIDTEEALKPTPEQMSRELIGDVPKPTAQEDEGEKKTECVGVDCFFYERTKLLQAALAEKEKEIENMCEGCTDDLKAKIEALGDSNSLLNQKLRDAQHLCKELQEDGRLKASTKLGSKREDGH